MEIILEVNNKSGCNFSEKKLKLVIERTVENSKLIEIFSKRIVVGLGFVSIGEMQKINKKYRGKNFSTDILSFANFDKQEDFISESSDELFLGDLIICCEDIEEYTREKGIEFQDELVRVVSHGTLHLLGFNHSKKMFDIQEEIVRKASNNL